MVIIIIYIYMILQHWGGKLYLTRAEYVTTFLYETSYVLVPDKKLVMSYIPPNSAGVISTFFGHRMKLFLNFTWCIPCINNERLCFDITVFNRIYDVQVYVFNRI